MRGAPTLYFQNLSGLGITPAHAGSTLKYTVKEETVVDHPCSRREHAKSTNDYNTKEKSPLLTRGAPTLYFQNLSGLGITPAHAGSTVKDNNDNNAYKDHPCSCGEHL